MHKLTSGVPKFHLRNLGVKKMMRHYFIPIPYFILFFFQKNVLLDLTFNGLSLLKCSYLNLKILPYGTF